jgi:predicted metal-dependent HD superfamily phosphohydrolase
MNSALAAQWHQLTAPILASETRREATLQQLLAAYTEPGRHYHTLHHIQALLDAVQRAAASLHDVPVVQLAVWFHDAVYSPLRSDNETRSAALALKFLAETTLEHSRQQRVALLIERTKDHTQVHPDEDPDLQLFLDADLSILGASEKDYWQYARQVHAEYSVVPDMLYRQGRRNVLEKLLTTPILYRTPPYRDRLDAAARRNLQAELHAWEKGGL